MRCCSNEVFGFEQPQQNAIVAYLSDMVTQPAYTFHLSMQVVENQKPLTHTPHGLHVRLHVYCT